VNDVNPEVTVHTIVGSDHPAFFGYDCARLGTDGGSQDMIVLCRISAATRLLSVAARPRNPIVNRTHRVGEQFEEQSYVVVSRAGQLAFVFGQQLSADEDASSCLVEFDEQVYSFRKQ
jgi:hypothetical protein